MICPCGAVKNIFGFIFCDDIQELDLVIGCCVEADSSQEMLRSLEAMRCYLTPDWCLHHYRLSTLPLVSDIIDGGFE